MTWHGVLCLRAFCTANICALLNQPSTFQPADWNCVMSQPITNGNVDPAVLAALPPSMQLDLLVQVNPMSNL